MEKRVEEGGGGGAEIGKLEPAVGPQSLKYLLSSPLDKKFTNPCSTVTLNKQEKNL
jgi:hypothetical protein